MRFFKKNNPESDNGHEQPKLSPDEEHAALFQLQNNRIGEIRQQLEKCTEYEAGLLGSCINGDISMQQYEDGIAAIGMACEQLHGEQRQLLAAIEERNMALARLALDDRPSEEQ